MGQAKRLVSLRMSVSGYKHIAERAKDRDVDVSTMHRWMLAYAALHMPRTWVPSGAHRREDGDVERPPCGG